MSKQEPQGRKRPTNVSLSVSLLEEAKALGVNVSQACERGLAEEVRATRARKWLEGNQAALASLNRFVDASPLGGVRQF
ncbi:type II toxin-antitoxin system CcdA family antitoxin [Allosphingosinicella deserti]|uniref:Post-segregation antitoxin CcdA n=1 Tax=Allosphingosinicella deserti TaxID=2116704 RepID=A0A2P7QN98_9SPHN|nr:type II toxin-antitoxin system CcdA family antitoxin [Sphingomonas deserti]PSJ39428.1 post-segregation antitoxin CcdA [Sphingomonas deserti]